MTCVDQSAANNRINRQLNESRNIASITIAEESFEALSLPDAQFDIAWSQEAVCHAPDLRSVFSEAYRVLKPGGEFVLCDTCSSESTPASIVEEMNRRNSVSLQTIDHHSKLAKSVGFEENICLDLSEHLAPHYRKMLRELDGKRQRIVDRDGEKFFARVVEGLEYWVRACELDQLAWGVWKFTRRGV